MKTTMKKTYLITAIMAVTITTAGCTNYGGANEQAGKILGGVLGGVAGKQVGKGDGRLLLQVHLLVLTLVAPLENQWTILIA